MSSGAAVDGQLPAARRRRLSGTERRQEISAAARGLFAQRGFDATTTREVSAAAGVSDALIYRHFSSKDAILRSLIDDAIEHFSTIGPPPGVDLREVPLEVLLTGLGRSFLAAVDAQLDLVVLFLSQRHLLEGDTRFVRFVDDAAAVLGGVLDHHHPEPAVPSGPGDGAAPPGLSRGYLLARGFMGSLVALALLQHHLGMEELRPVDPEEYLRVMVTTLLDGLRAGGSG